MYPSCLMILLLPWSFGDFFQLSIFSVDGVCGLTAKKHNLWLLYVLFVYSHTKKNTTKKMIHRKEWSKRRRRKTHGISHTFTLRDRNNDRLELRIFSSLWKNENRGANFFWRALRVLCTLLVHETLIHHASAQSYRLAEKATELWIFINRRSSLLSVSVPTFIYVLLGFFARALIKCILLSFPLFISP